MNAPTTAVLALMRPVLGELFPPDLIDRLARSVRLDPELVLERFDTPEAAAALAPAEILVTGWGCPRIDAALLDRAPRLRAVIHAAGSVKHIIDPECWERGIAVSSAAAANALPVAEYTHAVAVLAAKRAFALSHSYAAGETGLEYAPGRSPALGGTVAGVIGASRIGRLVIPLLIGSGCEVLLYDPYIDPAEAAGLGVEAVGLDELCRRARLITVHAPATAETRHMIDDRRLAAMADGTVLINTSRGSLIDTEALLRHAGSGRIEAVLDVTDPEPLPAGHPLFSLPNVLITPHLAGAHGTEVRQLGEHAVAEVERFVAGEPLLTPVFAADLARIA
jgi:phosphoglycerate dehydrogenase-like enzyme